MNFMRADLPYLKWPMLALFAAICGGTITVMAARKFSQQAQAELQIAQRKLGLAREDFASGTMDRNSMQSYRVEYGKLLERGTIGEERRLDWIEDMEKIRRQRHVPGFRYTISPQRPYTLPVGSGSRNFGISTSDMTMQIGLLHEGQLMDLLELLRSDSHGWFILHECSIERSANADTGAMLKATCTGGWLTLTHEEAA